MKSPFLTSIEYYLLLSKEVTIQSVISSSDYMKPDNLVDEIWTSFNWFKKLGNTFIVLES